MSEMNKLGIFFMVLVGSMLSVSVAEAQKGTGEKVGLARQGAQPELLELSGILKEVETGPCRSTTGRAYVGTHLFIETDDSETLNIHLGSAEAVKDIVSALTIGQHLDLTVFRTERHADGHFVAKVIRTREKNYHLRDETLRPFWAGQRDAPQRQRRRGARRH